MSKAVSAAAAALCVAGLAVATAVPGAFALAVLLGALGVLAGIVAWLEAGSGYAKEIVVVATLSGVASVAHVVLHPLPGVQPVTLIVVATGAALGARAGASVGATTALVSNFALGQGPWTLWQMLGWSACGVIGAALPPLLRRRIPFAITLGVLLAFSWTLLFLYQKSQAKPLVFKTQKPRVTDIVKKAVAPGSIVPRRRDPSTRSAPAFSIGFSSS
jgi:energy-coupling factor transport system substrate-specific component